MAEPLSQRRFAALADVSQQAVAKAIGRGKLIADEHGHLDPEHPLNATYLALHAHGLDSQAHAVRPQLIKSKPSAVRVHRAGNRNAVAVRIDTDPSEGEIYMRVMDYLLATTTATPPNDLGADVLDDILAGPPEAPDPNKPLFTQWNRIGTDREGADRALRVVLKEGGSPLALLCSMLEGLRGHLAVHLTALRRAVDVNTAAIAALRRDLLALENDDLSDDILARLDALEGALPALGGGV